MESTVSSTVALDLTDPPRPRDSSVMDLTNTQIAAIKTDGDYRVSTLLYLQVRSDGRSRSWTLRYRYHGRLQRMGLGPLSLISLKDAQAEALKARVELHHGRDPRATRDAARPKRTITFEEAAKGYVKAFGSKWKHPKHGQQVLAHLNNYAYPRIGKRPVGDIESADVVKILEPIWESKHETATRVRARIEAVLEWCIAGGHRPGPNPASWDLLQFRFPSGVGRVKHFERVEPDDAPKVYAALKDIGSITAKASMLQALTGMRNDAVLKARWAEFDLDGDQPVWTVPGERVKGWQQDFRVPLAPAAVKLLRSLKRHDDRPVFPGTNPLKPVSDTALLKALRKAATAAKAENADTVTNHGWRSCLRDWTADSTDYPREVGETAIAHVVGGKVERAYARTDHFERRVALMADWATYLTAP